MINDLEIVQILSPFYIKMIYITIEKSEHVLFKCKAKAVLLQSWDEISFLTIHLQQNAK